MSSRKSAFKKRENIKHARKVSRPPVFAQLRKYGTRRIDRSRLNRNVGR
ncbi:MAG: hypothetical protein M1441_01790 [Candidatus Parvarchaeota archaeon]|jgi:hypothetical protein|nr:hypothetical protein [Candidatus Parvarchaeota archaeon]